MDGKEQAHRHTSRQPRNAAVVSSAKLASNGVPDQQRQVIAFPAVQPCGPGRQQADVLQSPDRKGGPMGSTMNVRSHSRHLARCAPLMASPFLRIFSLPQRVQI